jgi:hypothetical protein
MRKPTKRIALVGAGAAGLLALGLSVPALAAAADPTPSPSTSPSTSASAAPDREQKRNERRAALAAVLAKELGIDQAKVADALEKAQAQLDADAKTERQAQLKERLDAAVKDGKLTQEQADAILEAAEAGVLPGGGHRGGPGR